MTGPDGDEQRIRALLVAQHARLFGHLEPTRMNGTPEQPDRPRDWLDDFLDATPQPDPKPEPEASPEQGQADERRRWWSVGRQPADEPAPPPPTQIPGMPPGLHITFTPPPTPPPVNARQQERRARARRWLAIHGAAAAVGYVTPLYGAMAAFLAPLGDGAPGAGIALAFMSWVMASLFTERIVSRYVPSDELRRVAAWALRIPFATALLATALHAPNALY